MTLRCRRAVVFAAAAVFIAACSSSTATPPTTTPTTTPAAPVTQATSAANSTAAVAPTDAPTTPGSSVPDSAPTTSVAPPTTAVPTSIPTPTVTPSTQPAILTPVKDGFLIAADRCAANKAAGTITFLSSLDFAASAGIVDVILAKQKRYFELMCLDVDVKAGSSAANYPLVGRNQAQFASTDSLGGLLSSASATQSDLVILAEEGKAPIDTLIVKDGQAPTIADVRGQTIGTLGAFPPSVQAMLAAAGLIAGTDYQLADIQAEFGADPVADIAVPTVIGFAASKATAPGVLNRAVIKFHSFDPSDTGIPGSFGYLYTNRAFATAHPSAVQDFLRATMKGLADAVANAPDASKTAFDLVTANGNPNALTSDGENFRWRTEVALIKKSTPETQPFGIPDLTGMQAEIDAYAAVGAYGGVKPTIDRHVDPTTVASVYDATGDIIWP